MCSLQAAQPEIHCMRFHWPSFQVLNQPAEAPDEEKPDSSGTTNFLSVPPATDARKSTDSINSCASTRCIVDICPNESFSGRDDISI
ncbi:hypothetical protein CDAR_172281 [Caerostris darwini]|uniref:Uncharacterized protein n=1 Tax=Caerostris darwini TaxID=1538125 RepID=A0AAV4MEW7_9ARAC|nr:hypothetical protein CDAR_172281 [Caerostris darwini]